MASAGADRLRPVLRPIRVLFAAGLLALGLGGLTACTDPCLELARKLCECQDTQIARENCIRNAEAAYQQADQDALAQSQSQCADLVDGCDCNDLDTESGKQACGLAR